VTNGSFNLHALSDAGLQIPSASRPWEILQIAPMDTALVALGEPDVLPDVTGPARVDKGFNFNLLNNAWGTNYVMWTPYGDGVGVRCKFRFVFVSVCICADSMSLLLCYDDHVSFCALVISSGCGH
jgi:hypothetical protein